MQHITNQIQTRHVQLLFVENYEKNEFTLFHKQTTNIQRTLTRPESYLSLFKGYSLYVYCFLTLLYICQYYVKTETKICIMNKEKDNFLPKKTIISLFLLLKNECRQKQFIKIRKFQKQIVLFSILPKLNENILCQQLSIEDFSSFFGRIENKKICF